MQKSLKIMLIVIMFILSQGSLISASVDRTYTYDENKKPVESVSGYEPYKTYFGTDLGIGTFTEPNSIFIDSEKNIFILDSGNSRIIKTDSNFKTLKIIDKFTLNGDDSPINGAESIFVAKTGLIYIADTANARIIAINQSGEIQKTYLKPTSELFPQNVDFRPIRVICDDINTVFAVCTNVYKGAVSYSEDGEFLGLYGSNQVEVNFQIIVDRFWRMFFSRTMRDKFSSYIPVEYSNFDIDSDNFIYTCTANTTSVQNMVRKLNTLGDNIIEKNVINSYQGGFGDMNPIVRNSELSATKFIDVDVDQNGFINCLDFSKGRIFQYDQDGNLIFVFGGIGNEMGNFITPTAIESFDDKILVLDKSMNSITVFKLTEFGKKVHTAFSLYNNGEYVKSMDPWKQVLKMNSNYNIAYLGIGKANFDLDNYEEAMRNFKIAGYRNGYDLAYNQYRTMKIRENFYVIFILITVLLLVYILRRRKIYKMIAGKVSGNVKKIKYYKEVSKQIFNFKEAVKIMAHPITGYSDLFYRNNQSFLYSAIIAFALFLSVVFNDRYYGFSFVGNNTPTGLFVLLLKSFGICVLFTMVNWSVSTLFDGKGNSKKIWIVLMYSLQPFIISQFVAVGLSNVLKMDEGIFITYIVLVAEIYSVLLLIKGLETIHEYSFVKCIITILVTLVGIVLIAVLFILLMSLVQQIIAFIITVYKEAGLRYR